MRLSRSGWPSPLNPIYTPSTCATMNTVFGSISGHIRAQSGRPGLLGTVAYYLLDRMLQLVECRGPVCQALRGIGKCRRGPSEGKQRFVKNCINSTVLQQFGPVWGDATDERYEDEIGFRGRVNPVQAVHTERYLSCLDRMVIICIRSEIWVCVLGPQRSTAV
nr:hypothetical protein CFP56_68099 [Quercus suber]